MSETDSHQELDAQPNTHQEPDAQQNDSKFDLDSAVNEIKELRKEAARYRTKAKELEENIQKLDESFKAEKDTLVQSAAALEEQLRSARIEVKLAGKVVDTAKALKLVDDSYFSDGEFQADRFLAENAFLQPKNGAPPLNRGVSAPTEMKPTVANWFEQVAQSKR